MGLHSPPPRHLHPASLSHHPAPRISLYQSTEDCTSEAINDHGYSVDEAAALLEACVREAAARVAATASIWHDHCVSPGEKLRVQVEQLAPLMDEMRVEWGYPGALWCAFWSAVRRAIRLRNSL